jgi:acyl carrier protein
VETGFYCIVSARNAVFTGANKLSFRIQRSKQENREDRQMDELFEKMKKLIADKLEVDADKITPDASFRQDLGADSLDTYELVYAIEEEMGITIPDEKANEFETVGDAYEYIKSQQK